MGAPKPAPASKSKSPEPTLGEILSGVDIIGTMLHIDIPRLEAHLQELKSLAAASRTPERPVENSAVDLTAALEDMKEALQLQNERLLSLERRLLHLTSLCEQWTSAK